MNDPENYLCSEKNTQGLEDLNMGSCLDSLNVKHCDTRDESGEQRFIALNPNVELNPDRSPDTFLEFLYPYQTGEKCCSKSTISFHYMSTDEMYTFDFLIYKFRRFY